MVAEWSQALSQIQVERMPRLDFLSELRYRSLKLEIICCYSNSRAPGGSICRLQYIEVGHLIQFTTAKGLRHASGPVLPSPRYIYTREAGDIFT